MKQQTIENPIIIHAHLLQKFMRHGKDFANLLALYSFYIYHAQLQKTNQPLATDEFTRKGLNWALDRVKKTKRILKEMGVIEVIQKQKYSYIHLFFIYTKKKITEIIRHNNKEKEPNSNRIKSLFENTLIESKIESKKIDRVIEMMLSTKDIKNYKLNHIALARWIIYCEKKSIGYSKNNLKHWLDKLNGRTTIEQIEAIHKAIDKKWKDFYLLPIKESKYHRFLGKSLMMDRDCDTLIDIGFKDKKFIYQFKNIKVITAEPPSEIFNRCGYYKSETKDTPIISKVRDKIMGCIQKM